MKIRFSEHAKMRCAQRRISENWLEARLMTVPFSPSRFTHEKLLDGTNIFVAYRDGSTYRTVVTLYLSTEPRIETKIDVREHLNDSRVQDMLNKAVGKSKRRGKRDKSKKRW